MSLLDAAFGMLTGNQAQDNDPKMMLFQAAMGFLNNSAGQQGGGLQGLIGTLQNAGLGDAVSSWLGSGANHAISGEQLQNALGSDQLGQLAAAAGLSHGDTANHLADILPGIIDKLSPNGQLPDVGNINPAELLQQFSHMFGK
jgi:predicted outer membrane repeat protein